jgi:type 1 fimbriae regulatory protein FimB
MARMVSLHKEELLKLLSVARSHSERDWLLILIAFNHGLRATEAVGLRKDNFSDGYISVKRLKGSLHTMQRLLTNPDALLDEKTALESYLAPLLSKDRLFFMDRHAFAYRVRKYSREAGIARHKASPHKLKHTCGMLSIKSAGIENVRQYLGHKSLASTGAYLRVTDEEASAAFAAALSR